MDVVEIEGLTKDYEIGTVWRKKRRALDRLTLSVGEGEIFGLIGPNGAGKTTTLRLLFGHVFPSAGRARILGRPLGDVRVRAEMGYLPENPYFQDYLTGRELLDYFGRLVGLRRSDRRARAEELLGRVGMDSAADMPLRRYSKGMVQRIGIAQALLGRPRLVFLDEPMSGLDPGGRREMIKIIQELQQDGVTVFFSSHILVDVEALCDRVAILNRGRLVREGRVSELQDLSLQGVELVVEGLTNGLAEQLRPFARQLGRPGPRGRIELADAADVDRALELIRSHKGRVISLNPVRGTLEEYFLREVGPAGGDRP